MRFLADENIGLPVIDLLRNRGHDTKAVFEELKGGKDKKLLKLAFREKRILITCDKDFAKLVYLHSKPHVGVVLLRLKDESPKNMIQVLSKLLASKTKEALPGSFVVVRESTVKVSKD